jgi:hypothetical protein
MVRKFTNEETSFLFFLALCHGAFAYDAANDMPELDIAIDQQDDVENDEMMESLYDQTEVAHDSKMVTWIKYHGTKAYARYIILKLYISKKIREMIDWVRPKKSGVILS